MKKYILLLMASVSLLSCKKFLDAKPDKKLVIPSTLRDLQGLLDDNAQMNSNNAALAEVAADDYFLTTNNWSALQAYQRSAYIWEEDLITGFPNDWSFVYDVVYNANLVLEHVEKIPRDVQNESQWNNIKGSALLFRSKSYLQAVNIWAKAYDENTASVDLGIPLRQGSDFNRPSVRSTVDETYKVIITDLEDAVPLLPVIPQHVMRPSRTAAYALLARTYLSMRRYEKAALYADTCLKLYNSLLNYNTLNAAASYPVPRFNTEVIMHSFMHARYGNIANSVAKIDSVLYRSYAANDLRKTVFFKANADGTFSFKGSYNTTVNLFSGIATDELYLIRAECYARAGNITSAMNDLNTLLQTRWKTGTFVPLSAANQQAALNLILTERRKELVFRDLRWMDIKRLNKEGVGIAIRRNLNNQLYVLPPNDNRFALALPKEIIGLSGMQQNPR